MKGTLVNEAEARHLLLVRAIEKEDLDLAVFTAEDRRQATAAGLASVGQHGPDRPKNFDKRFLAARTEFAFDRLSTRVPAIAQIDRQVRWPAWVGWALPCAALVAGVVTNEISDSNRLNIIAFPLLSMIGWNVVVYITLASMKLRRFGRAVNLGETRASLAGLTAWFVRRARPARNDGAVVRRAIHQFVLDWSSTSSALNQARVRRTFHLAAAALGAGVLIGMYARALGVEYRAGWESTFIDAETLRQFLQIVLGPASALTGVSLPDVIELEAIRWGQPQNGENAGRWIHLFATTAAVFIIVPRLFLAGMEAIHIARLARRLPVPGAEDFYLRRLLRDARDAGSLVRIVPYSFRLPADVEQRLKALSTSLLGERTEVTIDPTVTFGTEDVWLSEFSIDPETDHMIVLFNLSATPEAETHGDFVARLKAHLRDQRTNPSLTVIVEESAYRCRLDGQVGSSQRLEARRKAWNAVMSRVGVAELSVDLLSDEESALLSRLESVMMQDPQLTSGRTTR